jgi:hypothetical protein
MPATLIDRERRVPLQTPLVVSGRDVRNYPFTESTRTRNVSGQGLCYESGHNVTVGTRLALDVGVPPKLRTYFDHRDVYNVLGQVTRVGRDPSSGRYEVGVRLLEEAPPGAEWTLP